MFFEAIEHIPCSQYAHALNETVLVIRLRAKRGDIKKCILFYGDRAYRKDPIKMSSLDMKRVATDKYYDYFEVEFESEYSRVCYYFYLNDGNTSTYYYSDEFFDKIDVHRSEYFQFPYIRREDIADVPKWCEEAVMYQIFPDSFANGHKKMISKKKCIEHNGNKYYANHGGTIEGITQNIDYIKDMGFNCIYLNPIFESEKYHKYDTTNYFEIDPCFGTKSDFKELVKTCHDNGIRVILDGVFNHCGANFFAFKDVLKNQEKSIYKDWFYELNFPVKYEGMPNYACFAYVSNMPKLNTGNAEVIKYFCDVGAYWIKEADIDGWRLDVANEVNYSFWREFRKTVREVKSDAVLIGEIWEDAPHWLQGDQFDSSMNYRFANICKDFFAKRVIGPDAFDEKIAHMLMRYKKNVSKVQMNLVDSHDVPRFLSLCNEDKERLKLATLFMLTFEGMPSIYYGNEVGISGLCEDDYRKPMEWKENQDIELKSYFKKLIHIRHRFIDAIKGEYIPVHVDCKDNIYAYERRGNDKRILVVINNSEFEREIDITQYDTNSLYKDVLNDSDILKIGNTLSITLKESSGAIIPL